jgi:hypothetical protein
MTNIIAFAGYPNTGKDTAAKYFADRSFHLKFALPLKRFCSSLFCVPLTFWEASDRDTPMPELMGKSRRQVLQAIGQGMREMVHPDIWLHCIKRDYSYILRNHNVVFSDLRYPNEMRFIQELGGMIVYLTNPRSQQNHTHESESHYAIIQEEADEIIHNDRSIELFHQVLESRVGWHLDAKTLSTIPLDLTGIMTYEKYMRLQGAGWSVGTADSFLDLSQDESDLLDERVNEGMI